MDNINNEYDTKYSTDPPGAARYGNFISYYSFHPAEERTKLLPILMLEPICQKVEKDLPIAVLDVGCNTGELTKHIHKRMEEELGRRCCTLAIDLDPILITRAREAADSNLDITYDAVDVTAPQFRSTATNFLRDIGKEKFDVTLLFSTTMWIHLNHGDEGLKRLLLSLSSLSRSLVVEPQPWRCYRAAARRMRRSGSQPFEMFDKLRSRSDIEDAIVTYLETYCFMKMVLETPRTSWGRKLYIYWETGVD